MPIGFGAGSCSVAFLESAWPNHLDYTGRIAVLKMRGDHRVYFLHISFCSIHIITQSYQELTLEDYIRH